MVSFHFFSPPQAWNFYPGCWCRTRRQGHSNWFSLSCVPLTPSAPWSFCHWQNSPSRHKYLLCFLPSWDEMRLHLTSRCLRRNERRQTPKISSSPAVLDVLEEIQEIQERKWSRKKYLSLFLFCVHEDLMMMIVIVKHNIGQEQSKLEEELQFYNLLSTAKSMQNTQDVS